MNVKIVTIKLFSQ